MKEVFVLSIQHTGTFFASATISSGFKDSEKLRIGSLYARHKQLGHRRWTETSPIELSDFVKPNATVENNWFRQAVLSVCTKEELKDKKIIVGHEHHHKAGSWLINALHRAPAKISIIIPMRDPILSLHSKIWREAEEHKNENGTREKARQNRLRSWIVRYKEILTIPKGNVFLFPIDAEQSKTEESRIKIIREMHEYCNINFNDRALEVAKQWGPENRTFNLIKKSNPNGPAPRWEDFKQKYLERDVDHTKAIMGLEFEALRKEDELKRLMEKAGYKDVLWW